MQDQFYVVIELISIFPKDSEEGTKQLIECFFNSVMEEVPKKQTNLIHTIL